MGELDTVHSSLFPWEATSLSQGDYMCSTVYHTPVLIVTAHGR
jgi:hypothetical protein